MFSKTKTSDGMPPKPEDVTPAPAAGTQAQAPASGMSSASNKPKPSPSTLSSDLTIIGNVQTTGDIQIEGRVEGDIRAHLLTVGESATVKGEITADDVIVNGRVIGRLRGLKVRLTSTARVEGDVIHKTIAIESGAHFEGSVQRQDDPLSQGGGKTAPAKEPAAG